MIALVVLAAGRSTRMGSADKLMLMLGGKSVLGRCMAAATGSIASSVILVTNAAEMAKRYPSAQSVASPQAHLGQSHSIAAGIRHLHDDASVAGALIMLADMPFLTAAHINCVAAHAAEDPAAIWRPYYGDIPGHPVYWPRRFFQQLCALQGDGGAKALLQSHQTSVKRIAIADDGVTFDVDTPDRFAAAQARLVGIL